MSKYKMLFVVLGSFFTFNPCFADNNISQNTNNDEKPPLEIIRATPVGKDVKKVEQIVIQFNHPVVPVGEMGRDSKDIPIEITPNANCEWRWLNRSALACNLRQADYLKYATQYKVKVNKGIFDEEGQTIEKPYEFEFITERPKVLNVDYKYCFGDYLNYWINPTNPILNVRFNQHVTKSSVVNSLYIKSNGKNYPVKVSPFYCNGRIDKRVEVVDKNGHRSYLDRDEYGAKTIEDLRNIGIINWVVRPIDDLPADADYELVETSGLESVLGPEWGVEEKTDFKGATFNDFKFLGIECRKNDGEKIFIDKDNDESKKCSIDDKVSLVFNSITSRNLVSKSTEISPELSPKFYRVDKVLDILSGDNSFYGNKKIKERNQHQLIDLPRDETFSPSTKYTLNIDKSKIYDNFDRYLDEDVSFSFYTAERKPKIIFNRKEGVLEQDVKTDPLFYSVNVDEMNLKGMVVNADGIEPINHKIIPKGIFNMLSKNSFNIKKEVLGDKDGVFMGNFSLLPNVAKIECSRKSYWSEYYYSVSGKSCKDISYQATSFYVQARVGKSSGIVLVRNLKDGTPVKGAEVELSNKSLLNTEKEADSKKKVFTKDYKTDADGIAIIDGTDIADGDYVIVKKGDNFAYLPFDYDYKKSGYKPNTVKYWGLSAEGVYKPGAKVDYKIYVRDFDLKGKKIPSDEHLKEVELKIVDAKGDDVEKKKINFNDFGSYSDSFLTSKSGASGYYNVYINNRHALQFLVTDYVPATFKVKTSLDKPVYQDGETAKVSSNASLHSGGPFANAKNRYDAILNGKYFYPKDKDLKAFYFGSPWCSPPSGCGLVNLHHDEKPLDMNGDYSYSFTVKGNGIGYGNIYAEDAVRDDRGKNIAASTGAEFFGLDRFVGVKMDKYFTSIGDPIKFSFIVIDDKENIVEGIPVEIETSGEKYHTYYAKGAGENYSHNTEKEETNEGNYTEVSSKNAKDFEVSFSSPGINHVTLAIKDSKGNTHTTIVKLYISGNYGYSTFWNDNNDNDNLDIITKNINYKVGDETEIIVKNPFLKATGLITVERLGIIKSFTQEFNKSLEKVSFKITEDMVPGFNVTISLFSPRIKSEEVTDAAKKQEMLDKAGLNYFDMGKPLVKFAKVKMYAKGTKESSFDFDIKTDKEEYRPKENVKIDFTIKEEDDVNNGDKEVTAIVLDEAVYDLIRENESYFDINRGISSSDYDVVYYDILSKLITSTPAVKGAEVGGDGGNNDNAEENKPQTIRNNLKSLAFFKPDIIVGKDGKGSFSFKAPDNLTAWRIILVAVDKGGHVGMSSKNIKVNQPLEIQAAMPNQVLEGDNFVAKFTVMNRTKEEREVKVSIISKGDIVKGINTTNETIFAKPFERKSIEISLKADRLPQDRDRNKGEIKFTVSAVMGDEKDALEHNMVVNKISTLDVGADYGILEDKDTKISIKYPDKIRPDVGSLSLNLSPTLIGDIVGAFSYMKNYPYSCFEQKSSKALMAANYIALKKYLPDSFSWQESTVVINEMLDKAKDYQAPNGGMVYFTPTDDRAEPYLSAYADLIFYRLEKMGYEVPKTVVDNLDRYLINFLNRDELPSYYTKGMSSSVRAVAVSVLNRKGKVKADMVKRYAEYVKDMDLFGKSQLLEAMLHEKLDDLSSELLNDILSYSNESGGKFTFTETFDDGYSRMLSSTPRTNCSILSSLILATDNPDYKKMLGDVPQKLARSIRRMRGKRSHFSNTQENVFCTNALLDYANTYEKDEPKVTLNAYIDDEKMGEGELKSFKDIPLNFIHNINEKDVDQKKTLTVSKEGVGTVYYSTIMKYAKNYDSEKSTNAGIEVSREYSVSKDNGNNWTLMGRYYQADVGDLVRSDIYVKVPSAKYQIAVSDKIPGGLEPLNTDLATTSKLDADKAETAYGKGSLWYSLRDWEEYAYSFWSFNYKEIMHDRAVFYAEYLPPGNYHLAYMNQVIAKGVFGVQPVFAEEMYDPDVYGKGLGGKLNVLK